MPDFVTLSRGAKILDTVPVGDGGKVLNENFSLLNADMESLLSHTAATSGVHGATALAVPSRLVLRDSSAGATFAALTATSITDDISVQRVTVSGNAGATYARRWINFVNGTNVTVTVADNPGQNRVDVTLAASGGGGGGGASALADLTDVSVTSPTLHDGLYYNGSAWVNAGVPTFRGLTLAAGTASSALSVAQTWSSGGTDYVAARVNVSHSAAGANSRLLSLEVGSSPVMAVDRLGSVTLSSGTGTVRVQPANLGTTSDAMTLSGGVTTYLRVDGLGNLTLRSGTVVRLQTNATGIGVFGASPVAQAASTDDIKDALTAYGWLQGGGATPLDLDGGALTAGPVTATTVTATTGNLGSLLTAYSSTTATYQVSLTSVAGSFSTVLSGVSTPRIAYNQTGVGVFGVSPAARASATADIKDALTAYGWLQGTSATPLDLDGGTLTAGAVSTGAVTATSLTSNISTQRIEVAAAGSLVGTRKRLNLIQSGSVTLTVADDPGNDRVNVTVAASVGSPSLAGLSDVSISGLAQYQGLHYTGSIWANTPTPAYRGLSLVGTTVTTSTPPLTLSQTWNASGSTFSLVSASVTLTAAQAGSRLLDFKVNGSDAFVVTSAGAVTAGSLSVGAVTAISLSSDISTQRVELASGGTLIGTRKRINLIPGDNVSLSVVDNSAQNRVDVTVDVPVALANLGSYTQTFNATTDWGSASGGKYTITFTHSLASYVLLVSVWDETSTKLLTIPGEVSMPTSNTLSISVPDSPDRRFAGRIVILSNSAVYPGGGGGGGGATELADLTDVYLSSLTAGDVLQYNGSVWVNTQSPTLSSLTLTSLSVGAITATSITDNISTQRIEVAKANVLAGTKKRLNFIEGSNVTISMVDQTDRVDVTVSSAASGGTVSSVALSVPSWLSVSGSPVTTSGTITVTEASGQAANRVLATPNGSTGALSVRALVANDIPTLTASKISDFNTAVATTAALKANNLSDLADASEARTNLGLGSASSVTFASVSTANLFASVAGNSISVEEEGVTFGGTVVFSSSPTFPLLTTMRTLSLTTNSTATSGQVTICSITPTYNQTSGTASNTDLLINRTQTAVGSGTQRLIDAQVGGVSRFSVSNTGVVTADSFSGSGASLTSLNASSLSSGTVSTSRLGSGTASGTTFLRGDATWATLSASDVPTLTAAKISDFNTAVATTAALKANNLSDLANAATARSNLGLGSAATFNADTAATPSTVVLRSVGGSINAVDVIADSLEVDAITGHSSATVNVYGSLNVTGGIASTSLSVDDGAGNSMSVSGGLFSVVSDGSTVLSASYGSGVIVTQLTADIITVTNIDGPSGIISISGSTVVFGVSPSFPSLTTFNRVAMSTTSTATSGQVTICSITPTYNQTSGTASNTDLLINRTQTAVGSGTQRLIDAQVGGSSRFSVSNTGLVSATSGLIQNIAGQNSQLTIRATGAESVSGTSGLVLNVLNSSGSVVAGIRRDGLLVGTFVGTTDDSTVVLTQLNDSNNKPGVDFGSAAGIYWSNNSQWWGTTKDVAIVRSAAGTIRVSDGSSGFGALSVGTASASPTSTATSGSVVVVAITPTYNQTSGTAANTDLLINRTQTAIGSGTQRLIDAQVGGVSQFSVSNVGVVTASSFSGSGASLTSLNASNLSSGTVGTARLGSGTADSTTFLRGDASWATLTASDIPTLTASKISDFAATVSANSDVAANTAARHAAVTLGTASGLSLSGQQISLALATGSTAGAMSATDKSKLDGVAAGATANTGTVTSVDLSVPSWLSVSGSPVTTSGTLTVTAASGQTQNQVLATPNGSTGAVSLRALVADDIPTLTASKVSDFNTAVATTAALKANNLSDLADASVARTNLGLGSASAVSFATASLSVTSTATSGQVTICSITPTYNQSSGTASNTDLLINRTQTAVGSGTQRLIDAQVGGVSQFSVSNSGVVTAASFSGSGASLTSLNASNLSSGTVADARLSSNVAMRNASNAFAPALSASGSVAVSITPVYSQTGTSSATDLLVNRSGTVGTGTQRLLDLQLAGAARFSVAADGTVTCSNTLVMVNTGTARISNSGDGIFSSIQLQSANNITAVVHAGVKIFGCMADYQYVWRSVSSGSFFSVGSIDTGLARHAAGVVRVTDGSTGTGGLRIATSVHVPQTEPASPTNGQIYYDSGTHKFRGYANGAWVDLH